MNNLSIGIDIVRVDRIRSMAKQYGQRFYKKIFTGNEITEAQKKGHFFESLSGKFAAKEAFFKTQSLNNIHFRDIEVLSSANGQPYFIFQGIKQAECILSISHEQCFAIAVAISLKQ